MGDSVEKPQRLCYLEEKSRHYGLTESDESELLNLQNDYAARLMGREPHETDPVTGLPMEYNPAQITKDYDPTPVPPAVMKAFRKAKGEPEPRTTWWARFRRWLNG